MQATVETQKAVHDLLVTVIKWRRAEIHSAAVELRLREGDEDVASRAREDALRELRIAADIYRDAITAKGKESEADSVPNGLKSDSASFIPKSGAGAQQKGEG